MHSHDFSELIYTHCRHGIDILKPGRIIANDGFKVYSCTSALPEHNDIDLQFLFNAAQGKQPYKDPDFMDEAYLYYTPDKGKNFMVEFHPVPYAPDTPGDYPHSAGKFLNHVFVGDFSEFYPFETFGNKDIWNAKEEGEAFYYENKPPYAQYCSWG